MNFARGFLETCNVDLQRKRQGMDTMRKANRGYTKKRISNMIREVHVVCVSLDVLKAMEMQVSIIRRSTPFAS